ncbi:transglycosylase SLT domain-containing protein [Desulfovibrio litoralis]|uniref:Transglycosylase SLT domain-containing protein n=1 Tax=Desulfovibrio litoralis DSM 11393 TaxID=1121455 RepID=A0A1M7T5Z3_9BACT|nr:transglycosylase SLT domain-containing protein [Desulfovibrio litoralis]SHN66151.1 Transglycosylase SLT domain-containing protein [Desulfovibrio litoralis DSM 11393]
MSQNFNYLNKKSLFGLSESELQDSFSNKIITATKNYINAIYSLASLLFIIISFYLWRVAVLVFLFLLSVWALSLSFQFIEEKDTWIAEAPIKLNYINVYQDQDFDYIADFEKFGTRPWAKRYVINNDNIINFQSELNQNIAQTKNLNKLIPLGLSIKQGEVVLYGTQSTLTTLLPSDINILPEYTPLNRFETNSANKELLKTEQLINSPQDTFLLSEPYFLQKVYPNLGIYFLNQCKKTNAQRKTIGYRYSYQPEFILSGSYKTTVENSVKKYGLSSGLIYSIMRTESNYRPFAVSRSNAQGLMQLIPHAAGAEAHRFLTGKKEVPGTEILFDPIKNIEYGVAYVHLLFSRHFHDIENKKSRELCVIAAYNGGPNAIWRSFNPEREEAIKIINGLTPEEVYQHLTTKLNRLESRLYVDKILNGKEQIQ